jgi:predicted TIM-barrel fold metal-dependent hydrolase
VDAYQSLFKQDIPLEQRWATFAPFWELIRHTSYSRSVLISARRFFGVSDINDGNYQDLSAAIRASNRPGLYDRVLREACHIRTCLTQFGGTDTGTGLLTPVMPLLHATETWPDLHQPAFAPGRVCSTLDDYLAALKDYAARVKAEGAVGLKMSSFKYNAPDRKAAAELFDGLKSGAVKHIPTLGQTGEPVANPLTGYLVDEMVQCAGSLDLVVAVHTGYWGDFRQLDPLNLIPILQRHPGVRFDVYHLGYPWVRETLMLGKGFSNVWLNLCWNHIISERCAAAALDEAIDLLPSNKLIAFGGDYRIPVEKVYGHLTMARQNIAHVLAVRVDEGRMSEEQALILAHRWLWDNPRDLYRLKV